MHKYKKKFKHIWNSKYHLIIKFLFKVIWDKVLLSHRLQVAETPWVRTSLKPPYLQPNQSLRLANFAMYYTKLCATSKPLIKIGAFTRFMQKLLNKDHTRNGFANAWWKRSKKI